MGILDKFRKREEIKGEIALTLEEIPEWLNKKFSKEIEESRKKAGDIQDSFFKKFSEIKKSIETLENAYFEKGDKTYAAANMIKDMFVKKAKKIINDMQNIKSNPTYYSLKEFYTSTNNIILELKSIPPKQAYLLSHYFSKESEGLIINIKSIESNLANLNSFLISKNYMKLVEDAESGLRKREELHKQSKFLIEKEKNAKARIEELEKAIYKNDYEVQRLMENENFSRIAGLNEKLQNIKANISEIISKIELEFSFLSRPLKKFQHMVNSGYKIDTGKKLLLRKLINNTFSVVIEDDLEDIKGIVEELLKASDKEKISDAKEKEKIYGLVRKIGSEISWLKEKYRDMKENENKISMELEKLNPEFMREKKKLEDSTNVCKKEIDYLSKTLSETKGEIKKINEDIENQKNTLKEIISGSSELNVIVRD